MGDELCQIPELASIWMTIINFEDSEPDISEDDFFHFYELLSNIKTIRTLFQNLSEDIPDEDEIIELINTIINYLKSFINQKLLESVDVDKFEDNNTIDNLIHLSSSIYSIEIREASLSLLSILSFAFPIFINEITHTRYLSNMKKMFNEFSTENPLIHQYIKGFANLLYFHMIDNKLEQFLSLIDVQSFLQMADKLIESSSYLFIIYIISLLLTQNQIQWKPELLIEILNILSHAIAINFDEEIGYAGHLCVLKALNAFLKNVISAENIENGIIENSELLVTLDCYFDHEKGIFERCVASNVLASLYSLNIPDVSDSVFKLIPLFNEINEVDDELPKNDFIFLLCNSINIIIHSESGFETLLRMYPKGIIQCVITSIIKSSDEMQELVLIELLSSFIEINALIPPINSFYLSEGCIKLLLSHITNLNVIKSLCCIFQTYESQPDLPNLITFFVRNGGMEKLNEVLLLLSPEIVSFAQSIQSIVMKTQNSEE